ncbi:energy transducer TonB [candidate division KSB1 bacterium]|nr:energy transducer TonB [candidate division KSB1 bacterium]
MENPLQSINMKIAVASSVVLHLFIILIFYFIHTELDIPSVEFAEMSFVASSSNDMPMTIAEPSEQQQDETDQYQNNNVISSTQPPEPLNLPKMRSLDDEETEIMNRDLNKIEAGQTTQKIDAGSDLYNRKIPLDEANAESDKKTFVTPGQTTTEDKPSPFVQNGEIPGNQDQTFTIEGEAAERKILKQIIPPYPPDMQKEAVVKIRITVLPDGSMGPMVPVQKGDPVLEEITMKALRQWRFNPLSPTVRQKNVQGIVTFRYELR